jgi:hypothetical protein
LAREDIEQMIRGAIHVWLDEDDRKLALKWLDRHIAIARACADLEVTPDDDLDDTH